MSAPRGGDVAEWHVSINDVPVGPIRLDEMAHKIDAGAVSEYALVWREGFDEWRPLATVPELMALLHERRYSGPPSRTSFSSMPPFVDSRTSIAEPTKRSARPSRPSAARGLRQEMTDDFAPLADALQPETDLMEMSQPPAPLGPAGVFRSSAPLGSFSGLPAASDAQVSVPSVPPQAVAETLEPRSGLSLGGLTLIVAAAVFSAVVAFLLFDRFGDTWLRDRFGKVEHVAVPSPTRAAPGERPANPSAPAVHEAAPAPENIVPTDGEQTAEEREPPAEASQAEPAAPNEVAADDDSEAANAALAIAPPNPADNGPKMRPAEPRKAKVRREPRPEPVEVPPEGDSLSAADQKLLDEFDSSAHAAPAKIDIEKASSAQSDNPPLDGDGVRATVATNKPRLQRCYERAVRGQPSPASARLDVTVTVAPSGRVKNVSAEGDGPGGLAECIEASVRRWRFPESSEGGPAKFPLVFSSAN
ncbi:MAG: AgmX/PglI C-terminal domain-containing protein [Polyangiales bacterium]